MSLVTDLSNDKAFVRQKARHALVAVGAAAVPAVTAIATSEDEHVRWECAKTLATIADPSSIETLIKLLEDPKPGTAWDAGLGLIKIGEPAARPVLQAVIDRTSSFSIINGAHHVLNEMSKTEWGSSLSEVYRSLDSAEPAVTAPAAALKALESLGS